MEVIGEFRRLLDPSQVPHTTWGGVLIGQFCVGIRHSAALAHPITPRGWLLPFAPASGLRPHRGGPEGGARAVVLPRPVPELPGPGLRRGWHSRPALCATHWGLCETCTWGLSEPPSRINPQLASTLWFAKGAVCGNRFPCVWSHLIC